MLANERQPRLNPTLVCSGAEPGDCSTVTRAPPVPPIVKLHRVIQPRWQTGCLQLGQTQSFDRRDAGENPGIFSGQAVNCRVIQPGWQTVCLQLGQTQSFDRRDAGENPGIFSGQAVNCRVIQPRWQTARLQLGQTQSFDRRDARGKIREYLAAKLCGNRGNGWYAGQKGVRF